MWNSTASVPAIIDKGSSYIMELLGSGLRSERWKGWGGGELGQKGRKSRGLGKRSSCSFRAFLPLHLPGLFAHTLQAIEFVQYSFTVHNSTRLLSLKTLDQSYSSILKTSRKLQMFTADDDALITAHVECNAKLETNLRVLRDSPGSWGYHYRN